MTDRLQWDAINEMADGRAPTAPETAHLAECAACRSQLAALRAILSAAQDMPTAMDPPLDAWASIRHAIDSGKTVTLLSPANGTPRVSVSRRALVAAAVLVIALSSAVTTVALRGRGETGTPEPPRGASAGPAATLVSDIGVMEQEYLTSAATLRAALDEERATLSPATIAAVERNLRIIDDAIVEAREALMRDPASGALRELLRRSHQQKLDFLRRATALLHEA